MTLDRWNEAISTNLTGPFLCSREFVRAHPAGSSGGKIINVTSVHQDIPRRGAADYDAAKGGLRNLTTTLALELAPLKIRSEEHTSELQSLMRISYAVFCLKKKKKKT